MEKNQSNQPIFIGLEQVSDGWIKKYILKYKMPDGSLYEYESVSRKDAKSYEGFLRSNNETASSSIATCKTSARNAEGCDAICIVPVLSDGSLLLIREFRYALNDWIVAFPAGLVEEGESLEKCVERELLEETGYRLRKDVPNPVSLLPQRGYSSAGMTDECVSVAKALVEPSGSQELEDSELIETFVLPKDRIDGFLEQNEDLIGTRCQLMLESLRRQSVFSKD